jgi:hypothetical protein
MFSKKPSTPKAPWAIRLLTPDFLIDGYYDTEAHPESWPFFSVEIGATPLAVSWLASPRFTPVTTGAGPVPAVVNYRLPDTGNFAAMMPFDDARLAAMRKNGSSQKYPFGAALDVGPYAIRGQLLRPYQKPDDLGLLAGHLSLVVLNTEIEYRLPGAKFTGLRAPWMLVRTHLLQGFDITG